MPILETPPNPAPTSPSGSSEPPRTPPPPRSTPKPTEPVKVSTRRFGELEQHELIHLLDSIDDEIAKARFRESIYISIIICLALAWLALYGPRFIFHQGRIVAPKEQVTELNRNMLQSLNLPKNLVHKAPPRPAPVPANRAQPQPTPVPQVAPQPAAPAERPQPQPQQRQPTPQPPQPAPQPRPQQNQTASIPDAPRPSNSTRPNFGTPSSPGQSIRDAANAAAAHGGGNYGGGPAGHSGPDGAEILSDTLGVDFDPYIKRLLRILYNSWVPLIPEETRPPLNKEGETLIRFTINPDGSISAMGLDWSTKDSAIDRAAWGSITGVGQFPPLPKQFTGPNLTLRIHFVISHNAPKNDF
jgi:TonB family protein